MRQSSNTDTGFLGSLSSSSIRNLLPKSISSKRITTSSNPKSDAENTPPSHPNIQINHHHQPHLKIPIPQNDAVESDSPLDPPVKVVVRIGPENGNGRQGDWGIKKVSSDSLCAGDTQFTFDEVFDTSSNQEDVFKSVGVPMVKNALAGYNTSVLSYGQSGSGKTYTMWGPLSAMVEEPSHHSNQGIVPRIFRMLFSELEREKQMSDQKMFNYQCRCSFLEIYNDQIRNLLNPIQRNIELLQIKDDSKNAFYIENLIEEYVTSFDDIAQILIKGLSSRKVGATSINSDSSRSHIIFSFVIDSWCKQNSEGLSGSKTSKMSLIDLAGLVKDEVDEAHSQYLSEKINIEHSISQLGLLVDALTKESQCGKVEDVPYRTSCLTRLLQESLGGNSKLSVVCSISPDSKTHGETLHTLRFGQRVRSIRNKPVINEIEAGVDFSDTIRHLKEELTRAKTDVPSSVESKKGCSQGHNVLESLNQLRVSLNRSLLLPHTGNNAEEEININEDGVRQLSQQIDETYSSSEDNPKDMCISEDCVQFYSVEENCDADMMCDEIEKVELCYGKILQSPILDGPQLSESPKFKSTQRKSIAIASSYLGSWNNVAEGSNLSKHVVGKSFKPGEQMQSSLRSSKGESLAASLQRGIQIIDYHRQSSALNKSSNSFSFDYLTLTPCPEIDEVESSDQTIQQKPSNDEVTATLFCASCWKKISNHDSIIREELEDVCKEQSAKIEQLNQMVEKLRGEKELKPIILYGQGGDSMKDEDKLLRGTSSDGHLPYIIEEKCEIKVVQEELAQRDSYFDASEKESLLKEIQNLRSKLQLYNDAPVKKSTDKLRYSLVSRSIQLQKSGVFSHDNSVEDLENERQRWTEMESEWICLTDELRADLESYRQRAELVEMELKLEKKRTVELDDAVTRAVSGHVRIVEHYADLQEKYNDLLAKRDALMEGIAEVKKAAAKASKKGHARFAKSFAAELSALRLERERESKLLKKENQSLKIQLRDTAEAVQAAGELLVRLREAEHAASVAEENFANVQHENEELKMQVEKLKRKHKTEISTMKHYITESKLPESALQPMYREDSATGELHHNSTSYIYDDQAWRAEFGAIYQEHY